MIIRQVTGCLWVLLLPCMLQEAYAELHSAYDDLGLSALFFEKNIGQASPEVKFISRGRSHSLYFYENKVSMALRTFDLSHGVAAPKSEYVTLVFEKANESVAIVPRPRGQALRSVYERISIKQGLTPLPKTHPMVGSKWRFP